MTTLNVKRSEAGEKLRTSLVGSVVAMTTPFKKDLSLDIEGIRKLTRFYKESGIKNVIAAGSTGEFHALTDEERKQVIKAVVDENAGSMTVIGCAAHSGTAQAVELAKYCEQIGCDGIMVTPPYYTYSGMEGFLKHLQIINDNANIGIVVYFSGSVLRFPDINSIAQNRFECPKEMYEIAKIPNVGAFKDASGNYGFHRDICLGLDGENKLMTIMGSAGMGYHVWGHMFGSRCYLTGLGNIWPEIEVDFFNKLDGGDQEKAMKIVQEQEIEYLRVTAGTGKYWASLKYMLDVVGLPGGPMRPPLVDLTEQDKKNVDLMLQQTGLLK